MTKYFGKSYRIKIVLFERNPLNFIFFKKYDDANKICIKIVL